MNLTKRGEDVRTGRLSVTGGNCVRKRPFPSWPQFDDKEQREVNNKIMIKYHSEIGPLVLCLAGDLGQSTLPCCKRTVR